MSKPNWSRPYYGVTHLQRDNRVATVSDYGSFSEVLFYLMGGDESPWFQPQHTFLPQDGVKEFRFHPKGDREYIYHHIGKGADHLAAAKRWGEKMVGE